jgi:hypothetical protein
LTGSTSFQANFFFPPALEDGRNQSKKQKHFHTAAEEARQKPQSTLWEYEYENVLCFATFPNSLPTKSSKCWLNSTVFLT